MFYQLFNEVKRETEESRGVDVLSLLTCLDDIGQLEVADEKDKREEGVYTIVYGAPAIKANIFLFLLNFILKVNRLYTAEEVKLLKPDLDNLVRVISESVKQLKVKLNLQERNKLEDVLHKIQQTKAKIDLSISNIAANGEDERSTTACKSLIQTISMKQGEIQNTLVAEGVIKDASMKINPPKRSIMRQIFDYGLSLLGGIGAGTGMAFLGAGTLVGLGLTPVGIIGAIVGLALLVGGVLAFSFRLIDQKRKQKFCDTHKDNIKEYLMNDASVGAKKNQWLIQGKEEQLIKLQKNLKEHKEESQKEIITLKEMHERKLQQKLDSAQQTISSQQKTLMMNADTIAKLNTSFAVVAEYVKICKSTMPPVEHDVEGEADDLYPFTITHETTEDVRTNSESKPNPSVTKALQVEEDTYKLICSLSGKKLPKRPHFFPSLPSDPHETPVKRTLFEDLSNSTI
ncbi:MAG: hypothetical protein H0U75_03065 [Legionella sp.]|nr:hypothetical protein [Legionella sp.]